MCHFIRLKSADKYVSYKVIVLLLSVAAYVCLCMCVLGYFAFEQREHYSRSSP